MAEVGVDLSTRIPRRLDAFNGVQFDCVVTVCDAAARACPALTGALATLHAPFDAPPRLAKDARTDEEALPHYRRVRDEIRRFVERLPDLIPPA